jgi:hypothetical protein
MISGNLNFLEPSGPLQACNGTALMVHSLSFLETKYATQCTQLVEKYVVLNNMTVKLTTILKTSEGK